MSENLANALRSTVEDIKVFILVAASEDTPLTQNVIGGLERWFNNVEIVYPISEMGFSKIERDKLIKTVTQDMVLLLEATASKFESGSLSDEAYSAFSSKLDGLWRELASTISSELNAMFNKRMEMVGDQKAAIANLLANVEMNSGEEGLVAIREQAKEDPGFRTWLRKMGLNPDEI